MQLDTPLVACALSTALLRDRATSPPCAPPQRADDSPPVARRRARAAAPCAPVADGHLGGDVGLLVGELVPARDVGHAIVSRPKSRPRSVRSRRKSSPRG